MCASVAAVVLVAVLVTSGGGGSVGEPAPPGTVSITRASGPPLEPGEAVPDWSAPALDGSGRIRWSDLVGTPTVLTVWAPWCPHCQAELPRLVQALAQHPRVDLVTISTAVERSTAFTSQGYLDSVGLDIPVAIDDANLTLHEGFGVAGFPTVYFVNADGTVQRYAEGEIGLQPDDSIDPGILEAMLGELEGANPPV